MDIILADPWCISSCLRRQQKIMEPSHEYFQGVFDVSLFIHAEKYP